MSLTGDPEVEQIGQKVFCNQYYKSFHKLLWFKATSGKGIEDN